MLGKALLIAPIVNEKQVNRKMYFPIGNWYNFQTGRII